MNNDIQSNGWFALHRGEELQSLQERYPDALLLLIQIASRVRRTPCHIQGLDIGEAHIGDFRKAGLSEQRYRTAKKKLKEFGFVTFKPTSKGTIAKLVKSTVCDPLSEHTNGQSIGQATEKQRTANGQATTNNKDNKAITKELNNLPPISPKGENGNQPTLDEFCSYLIDKLPDLNPDWTEQRAKRAATMRYETYLAADWKDGNGKPIKNWKTKAVNAIKFEKPWSYGNDSSQPAHSKYVKEL